MTILIKNPNFLILDEPTNDLDILTLSILEEFLADFPGCLLVVSHDRYFMDRLSDHLFVFEGDGVIKDFPGNYSDYRDWLEAEQRSKRIAKEDKEEIVEPEMISRPKEKKKKLNFKERQEFHALEKEIHELEERKKRLQIK